MGLFTLPWEKKSDVNDEVKKVKTLLLKSANACFIHIQGLSKNHHLSNLQKEKLLKQYNESVSTIFEAFPILESRLTQEPQLINLIEKFKLQNNKFSLSIQNIHYSEDTQQTLEHIFEEFSKQIKQLI